mgnify:CR=1 FL=1
MHTVLKDMNESAFVSAFEKWKRKWHDFLKEKTVNEITGRTIYTHQRLRSAMVSISTYLPFLFTYEKVRGMPKHKQYDRRHIHRHEESLAESSGND